jgi:hypothetical protein
LAMTLFLALIPKGMFLQAGGVALEASTLSSLPGSWVATAGR